ncbi:hypothetical protein REPUB_Repub15cG0085800 [Reevesia pubescens]
MFKGKRWSDGLHQAVEAKQGLPIQNETITLASISYQNFFLQFPKLCGMTGTAATESTEFESIYKLKVTIVPTNKPKIRKDESDVVFRATNGKWRAVVVEISRMNKTGRPVLVGTTSVEKSDSQSEQLQEAGFCEIFCCSCIVWVRIRFKVMATVRSTLPFSGSPQVCKAANCFPA